MPPENEYAGALSILRKHYQIMMLEIAEDIILNEEEFAKGGYGGAGNLLERYNNRLYPLCSVFANLRSCASKEKPKGSQPLKPNEFRCFGCGGVIREEDTICGLCGWTWK